MNPARSLLMVAVTFAVTATTASAGIESEYEPILKELNAAACVMKNPDASNSEKAAAQQRMMAAENRLAPIKQKLMTDMKAATEFSAAHAEASAGSDCKGVAGAEVRGSSNAAPMLEAYRTAVCEQYGSTDPMKQASAAGKAAKLSKELKTMQNRLKQSGDEAAAKEVSAKMNSIAMGSEC